MTSYESPKLVEKTQESDNENVALYIFKNKNEEDDDGGEEVTPNHKISSNHQLEMSISRKMMNFLIKDWRRYLVLLSPIFMIWLPLMSNTTEARCGYVIVLMAIFYMTEALPLAVTALMPVFAFPLLGIVSTNAICMVYMKGTAMMFFGGLTVAIAVEHCNLHKRIALYVILKVGQSPRRLTGSFIFTSMFLSMWISNTAATAMMVPILDAILQELYKNTEAGDKEKEYGQGLDNIQLKSNSQSQIELVTDDHLDADSKKLSEIKKPPQNPHPTKLMAVVTEERLSPPDPESEALSTMCFLATAYGSNLGGTGFPTGTGANIVLWGILQSSFPSGTGLDFATWMAFNVPGMLIGTIITWIWLEIHFMGFGKWRKVAKSSKEKEEAIRRLVQKHYDALGEISFHEITVLIVFLSLVCLWVFRAPEFIVGWAELVQGAFGDAVNVGNATPAILIVFVLFVLPAQPPWRGNANEPTPACLTWDAVHKKVPWGLVILMGGGFAMAEGASQSGLSSWIRIQLQGMNNLPVPLIVFLISLITTFLTEIISNITAASILLPVMKDMAIGLRIHPLYLMLPATISCSYAFMLPVANPPNAIAFNASTMKNSDMIKAGFILNLLCILVITGMVNTWGVYLFDLHEFPVWAQESINETLTASIS